MAWLCYDFEDSHISDSSRPGEHLFWFAISVQSSEVTRRLPQATSTFLPITSDRNEAQTCAWSHCVSLIEPHRMICNMTCLVRQVTLTRFQPEVKSWPWSYGVTKRMFRCALKRGIQWNHAQVCILFVSKVIREKEDSSFDLQWPLVTSILTWAKIWPK